MPNQYYEPNNIDPISQALENKLVNNALSPLPTPYISGLKLNADISINGLTLNTVDSNNVIWVMSDLQGWWTLPDSELPDLPRGWGDGSYDAIGRWANRNITLTGSFLPQKPQDAAAARNSLIQALSLVKTGGWLIVNETPTRAAYVRLSGTPDISSVNAKGRHDFSIGLKAVDPIKYEWVDGASDGYNSITVAEGSTSATVLNTGNTPVPLIFEITGALSPSGDQPATIINDVTGDTISIVGSTTSSQRLEIDTYNREVLIVTGAEPDTTVVNGRSKAAVLIDWMYLEPGVPTTFSFDDPANGSSTASCKILWRSGWIG
jgi:hypothetical protein